VIPGYGGRDDGAAEYASMFMTPGVEELAPLAVHIVLDPELPLGHHGFADSANNGPVGEALVKELIPHIESRFRLVARPEARLVTGHSSGGWSSLWLQLTYPDVFGGCWSSAPDPIDFRAFQMTNIYDDASTYHDAAGAETPSHRRMRGSNTQQVVTMTVRQENLMEYAIDPTGHSGQQWDAWEAMFSPRDEATGMPRPLFDPMTGKIDREVVEHWKRYDIARAVREGWEELGPVVKSRVHLAVGDEDNFYLERGVQGFAATVEEQNGGPLDDEGGGYVLIVPMANHGTLSAKIFQRWNKEMREHLQKHGLQDLELPPARVR
jgi:S-formylglutathione hydrolase FrmB